MSQRADTVPKRRDHITSSRRFVLVAFTLIGVGVPLFTVVAVTETRALEARARDIVDKMLTSVRVLGKLENEVQTKQILMEEHVLATQPGEMRIIEANVARNDALIGATMLAYERWATQPDERDTWERTRADLIALEGPITRALALSRENRDVEAREVMMEVVSQFALVTRDFEQLISINDQGATGQPRASLRDPAPGDDDASWSRRARPRRDRPPGPLGRAPGGAARGGDGTRGKGPRGPKPRARRVRRASRARHPRSARDDQPRGLADRSEGPGPPRN